MIDVAGVAIIAVKSALLFLVPALASLALARRSAACRHVLWMAALAFSLLMPFAVLWLPGLAMIPASWVSGLAGALGGGDRATVAAVATGEASGLSAATVILIVWAAGVTLVLLRAAAGWIGLRRWARRARPVESEGWRATLRGAPAADVADRLRLLESDDVASPCTWGLIRPVLLLPRIGAQWPEARRRHVLAHELAHVRRRDCVGLLIARFACAVHWYNPLAWYAAAQLRKWQEQASDDAVLRDGARPSDYAETLLSIAAQAQGLPFPACLAAAMCDRSPLHVRIAAILHPGERRLPLKRATILAAAIPFACVTAFVAVVAIAQPREPPPPVQPPDAAIQSVDPVAPTPPIPSTEPVLPVLPVPPVPPSPPVPAVPAVPAVPPTPPVAPYEPLPVESPPPQAQPPLEFPI